MSTSWWSCPCLATRSYVLDHYDMTNLYVYLVDMKMYSTLTIQ